MALPQPHGPVGVHSDFALAFTPGAVVEGEDDGDWTLAVHPAGTLRLVAGTVSLGDPFVGALSHPPLDQTLPPGAWPVEVAVARMPKGDERVVAARLRVSDAPIARVSRATLGGGETDAEFFVDAGTGGFACAARAPAFDTEAAGARWLAAFQSVMRDTWATAPLPDAPDAAVAFSTGWGDGVYPAYWAWDEGGAVVGLYADFELLLRPVYATTELPWPPGRGAVPLNFRAREEDSVSMYRPWLGGWPGFGPDRLEVVSATPPRLWRVPPGEAVVAVPVARWRLGVAQYDLGPAAPGTMLRVGVVSAMRPAERRG